MLQLSQVHSTRSLLVFYGCGAEARVRDLLVAVLVLRNVSCFLFVAWVVDKLFLGVEAAACDDEYQKEQVYEQDEVKVSAANLAWAIRVRLTDSCHGELLLRLLDVA